MTRRVSTKCQLPRLKYRSPTFDSHATNHATNSFPSLLQPIWQVLALSQISLKGQWQTNITEQKYNHTMIPREPADFAASSTRMQSGKEKHRSKKKRGGGWCFHVCMLCVTSPHMHSLSRSFTEHKLPMQRNSIGRIRRPLAESSIYLLDEDGAHGLTI